jgi:hypothetical protein
MNLRSVKCTDTIAIHPRPTIAASNRYGDVRLSTKLPAYPFAAVSRSISPTTSAVVRCRA